MVWLTDMRWLLVIPVAAAVLAFVGYIRSFRQRRRHPETSKILMDDYGDPVV